MSRANVRVFTKKDRCEVCGSRAYHRWKKQLLCDDCLTADDPEAPKPSLFRSNCNFENACGSGEGISAVKFGDQIVQAWEKRGIPRTKYAGSL